MNVSLINPNTRTIGRIATTNPPLGLLYMASYLRNSGHKVQFIDADVDNLTIEDILSKVESSDLIGITLTTMQATSGYALATAIKKRYSKKTVVVGGAHPSGMRERIFKDCPDIDYCVVGEGEMALLNLVSLLSRNIAPISKIVSAERLNIDSLMFPAVDLAMPINRYKPYYPANRGKQPFPIMASRGCLFNCHYCGTNMVWGQKMTYRKPENIMEEIELLHTKYGVDEIYFLDDALNYNREWIKELLDLIIAAKLPVIFKGSIRANKALIDAALAEKFKKAGFWCLAMGVESGNQHIRDSIGKNLLTSDIERAFKILRKAKLQIVASFMIGHIEDNEETVNETIDFALKLLPDQYDFPLCTPLPGTILEKEAEHFGLIISQNWADYAMGKSVMCTRSLPSDRLIAFREVAFTKLRRKQLIKKMTRNPVFAAKYIVSKLH